MSLLPKNSKKGLFYLAAGMFAMGCEDYLFAGLLPGLSKSLGSSIVMVAQGCVVFGLAYLASIPFCAILLSRQNARSILITALVVFITGNLLTLFSINIMMYLTSRFVAGLGGGLFLPVAVAAATQMVEPDFRGRALSLMWGSNSAGAVLGVPIGLWLAARIGWQATVILILLLPVLALLGLVIGKPILQVEAAPPSLKEQFLLLLNHQVLSVVGITFLTATGCLGLYSYITQILSDTQNSADIAFSIWSIGGLMGIIGVGYVLDRTVKTQWVMVAILIILFLVIAAIPALRWIPTLGFLPFLVWGAMGWASVTPQQFSLIKIMPNHEAILVALNSSAVSLGSVIGTALGGVALSSGLDAGKLPYMTALFVMCALICQLLLIRSNWNPKKSNSVLNLAT